MKDKYQGIVSMGVVILLFLSVGGYYSSGWWVRTPQFKGPVQPPVVDGWMPSPEQIQTMAHFSGSLPALARPEARGAAPANLLLFGQNIQSDADPQGNPGHARTAGNTPSLSLTLLAGPIRYCIVDGAFVAEGARLADGTAVMKIDNQKILIAKDRRVEWIHMEEDLQRVDRKKERISPKRVGPS